MFFDNISVDTANRPKFWDNNFLYSHEWPCKFALIFEDCDMHMCKIMGKYILAFASSEGGTEKLNIVFSDEPPKTSKYCFSSLDEVAKHILELWYHEDIRMTLLPLSDNPKKEYLDSVAEMLACKIAELFGENRDKIYGTINSWLRTAGTMTLGTYNNSTKTITLYNKAIEQAAESSGIDLQKQYEAVFCHELFHAFHYYLSANNGKLFDDIANRNDYTIDVILEGLASYYEYLYCEKYVPEHCGELRTSWYNSKPYEYPYSAAKWIGNKNEFIQLLNISADDCDGALRKLFCTDPNTFYKIKNVEKAQIIKTPNKKRAKKPTRVSQNAPVDTSLLEEFKKYLQNTKRLKSFVECAGFVKNAFEHYYPSADLSVQNASQNASDLLDKTKDMITKLDADIFNYDKDLIGLSLSTLSNRRWALGHFIHFLEVRQP